MIELGVTVRDRITGFEGVVMGRTEYITGCTHIGVQSKKLSKEGKMQDWEWIDETRCEVIDHWKISLKPSEQRVGGPAPNAPSM
jgi:hypothetical protein